MQNRIKKILPLDKLELLLREAKYDCVTLQGDNASAYL